MEDKGKACYAYLSQNEHLPRQAETLEEGLVATIRTIKAAVLADNSKADNDGNTGEKPNQTSCFDKAIADLTSRGAPNTRSAQNKLFSQRYLLEMLMYMIEFDHGYFQRTKMLRKNWLNEIINVHGAVR